MSMESKHKFTNTHGHPLNYRRSYLAVLVASTALSACGGGGGGGVDGDNSQTGLDSECVALFSAPPYEYSDQLIQLTCTDDAVEDVNLSEDDSSGEDNSTSTDNSSDTASSGQVTSGNDVPGANFYLNASGAALLSGPVVGGTEDGQNFTARDLPFTVNNEHADLKIVSLRAAAVYDIIWKRPGIIGVLENVSDNQHCGIYVSFSRVVPSETADAQDAEFFDDSEFINLEGTSATFGFTKVEDCVGPRSKYYFHKSFTAKSTTDFASVEINKVVTSADNSLYPTQSDEYGLIAPTAIATSYQINDEGKVELNIANQSSEEANGHFYGTTVYGLDAEGRALFASTESGFDNLLPGAEGIVTMSQDTDEYPGPSTSLRVNAKFQLQR